MMVRKMTRLALLSAILYVSKALLEFLPNVELVSLLTILYTLVFGKEALIIVTVFNCFEVIQWGFGLWVISYLYTWPALVIMTLAVRKLLKEEFVLWAIFSGIFGLLFGAFFAVAYIPANPAFALAYWIRGLPWDVWHAAANFVLMLILGKPLYKALCSLKRQTWNL